MITPGGSRRRARYTRTFLPREGKRTSLNLCRTRETLGGFALVKLPRARLVAETARPVYVLAGLGEHSGRGASRRCGNFAALRRGPTGAVSDRFQTLSGPDVTLWNFY